MKMITAVIKHHMLEPVKGALQLAGIDGMTVSEVRGFGRQGGHVETYRGSEYTIDFIPKLKLEVVVDDGKVDEIVEAIQSSAHTGRIGDGKIWVAPVDSIVRIRTGELGSEAL